MFCLAGLVMTGYVDIVVQPKDAEGRRRLGAYENGSDAHCSGSPYTSFHVSEHGLRYSSCLYHRVLTRVASQRRKISGQVTANLLRRVS